MDDIQQFLNDGHYYGMYNVLKENALFGENSLKPETRILILQKVINEVVPDKMFENLLTNEVKQQLTPVNFMGNSQYQKPTVSSKQSEQVKLESQKLLSMLMILIENNKSVKKDDSPEALGINYEIFVQTLVSNCVVLTTKFEDQLWTPEFKSIEYWLKLAKHIANELTVDVDFFVIQLIYALKIGFPKIFASIQDENKVQS